MAYLTLAEFSTLIGQSGQDALASVSDDDIGTALDAVSDETDDYLRTRYAVPLADASVSRGLKRHLSRFALADLLDARGRSPLGDDSLLNINREDAKKYLTMLAKGVIVLDVAAPTLATDAPAAYSDSDETGYSPRWGNTTVCED